MSSSSDLETPITQQVAQRKKNPTKKKAKQATIVATDEHGRNEGDDPHWAYEPPKGAALLDHSVDAGAFEWDAIKNDEDTEIWLIRVPDLIKPKYLDGLEIDAPSSSRTALIGSLARKNSTYNVWSVGDDGAELAGAEELRNISCLLPRKRKKGRLYIAPKHVSHHIVISAPPPVPTVPEHPHIIHQNPPRPSHPKDLLRHSFVPYGARSGQTQSETMNVDVEATVEKSASTVSSPEEKSEKIKESKGRKRKVEGETPKKSKKHKANT